MEFKGYTNIPDWMLSLDLDVYETIILAVIFGFSQDGDSTFSGTQNYLARKAKCTRRKVTMALPKLVEKGLIVKIDKDVRGIHLCEYRVSPTFTGCECHSQGGCECGAHNNNIDNNIYNNTLSKKESHKFVKPSVEEIRQYCSEQSINVDAETFYNFYESKGWMVGKSPMKNWQAAIATWVKREKESPKKSPRSSYHKESSFERSLKAMDQMFGTDLHQQAYGTKEDCDEQ